tara:strand:+ start:116 stop:526 length:411 start_codon:yes stop_codon:yes gene_type:complete
MTLSSPLKTQLEKPENTTLYAALLQQNQNLAAIGQRYTDIVWAAALFEGEGCISIFPNRRTVQLIVKMTDLDVMERLVNVAGYGNLRGPLILKGLKPSWRWTVAKKTEVIRILKMFLPHFGKRRAEKAIEAINYIK